MMDQKRIANHYTRDDLLEAISIGIEKLGKSSETVTIEDLACVDEFHIGGSLATRSFLDQVAISDRDHVLDIGSGIGGASRFAAQAYGCRVTGIDLTATYVETGKALCSWTGLEHRVNLIEGNALATNFPANTFDKAFMLHVGMNIADKVALAEEVWRILKPGGVFGIYDVMSIGDGELKFPVPWATSRETSSVASPDVYKDALSKAGFKIERERNCRDFALAFFERLRTEGAATPGNPHLGLHLLMGKNASAKIQNMINNISRSIVAPVELIARKAI